MLQIEHPPGTAIPSGRTYALFPAPWRGFFEADGGDGFGITIFIIERIEHFGSQGNGQRISVLNFFLATMVRLDEQKRFLVNRKTV
jgi:hypothetical protein